MCGYCARRHGLLYVPATVNCAHVESRVCVFTVCFFDAYVYAAVQVSIRKFVNC